MAAKLLGRRGVLRCNPLRYVQCDALYRTCAPIVWPRSHCFTPRFSAGIDRQRRHLRLLCARHAPSPSRTNTDRVLLFSNGPPLRFLISYLTSSIRATSKKSFVINIPASNQKESTSHHHPLLGRLLRSPYLPVLPLTSLLNTSPTAHPHLQHLAFRNHAGNPVP